MQLHARASWLIFVIVILHAVGALGIAIPQTRDAVIALSPVNLVVSAIILLSQSCSTRARLSAAFALIYLIGLAVEILGVQTGLPFGEYAYGNALGPQLLGAPLVIGVLWFMLSYAFYIVSQGLGPPWSRVFISSGLMTLMDVLIEPIAVKLHYWAWASDTVPVANYISWFMISLVMQVLLRNILGKDKNKIAFALLVAQAIFFCLLYIPDF